MKKQNAMKKLVGFYRQFEKQAAPKAFSGNRKVVSQRMGGSANSDNFGKYGDQSNLSEQRGADADGRA